MKNYLLLLILLLSVYGYGQGNKKLLFDSNKYFLWNAVTGSNTVTQTDVFLYGAFNRIVVPKDSLDDFGSGDVRAGSKTASKYMTAYKLFTDYTSDWTADADGWELSPENPITTYNVDNVWGVDDCASVPSSMAKIDTLFYENLPFNGYLRVQFDYYLGMFGICRLVASGNETFGGVLSLIPLEWGHYDSIFAVSYSIYGVNAISGLVLQASNDSMYVKNFNYELYYKDSTRALSKAIEVSDLIEDETYTYYCSVLQPNGRYSKGAESTFTTPISNPSIEADADTFEVTITASEISTKTQSIVLYKSNVAVDSIDYNYITDGDFITFSDSGIGEGAYYKVKIYGTYSNATSDSVYKSPIVPFLPTPTDLFALGDTTGIRLNWQDNSIDEEGFIIRRRLASLDLFSIPDIDTVSADVVTYCDSLPDITGDTDYIYEVYVFKGIYGGASNRDTATAIYNVESTNIVSIDSSIISIDTTEGTEFTPDLLGIMEGTSLADFSLRPTPDNGHSVTVSGGWYVVSFDSGTSSQETNYVQKTFTGQNDSVFAGFVIKPDGQINLYSGGDEHPYYSLYDTVNARVGAGFGIDDQDANGIADRWALQYWNNGALVSNDFSTTGFTDDSSRLAVKLIIGNGTGSVTFYVNDEVINTYNSLVNNDVTVNAIRIGNDASAPYGSDYAKNEDFLYDNIYVDSRSNPEGNWWSGTSTVIDTIWGNYDTTFVNILTAFNCAEDEPPIPPSQVTGLDTVIVTTVGVLLEWDNLEDESGYYVQRKLGGQTASSFINIGTNTVNDTTYTDDTVSDSTWYTYRVYAYNAGGNGDYSDTLRIFTDDIVESEGGEGEYTDTLYVTASATGSGNGQSIGSPYTLTQAFANAVAGNLVLISSGNYTATTLTTGHAGTADSRIEFRGADSGNKPIITKSSGTSAFIRFYHDYITLKDVHLVNSTAEFSIESWNDGGQRGIIIDGIDSYWNYDDGARSEDHIRLNNFVDGVIRNCNLIGSGSNLINIQVAPEGLQRCSNWIIENNDISVSPYHHAINIFPATGWNNPSFIDSFTIRNNHIHNIQDGQSGIYARYIRAFKIYNNIFSDISGNAIVISPLTATPVTLHDGLDGSIDNNVMVSSSGTGVLNFTAYNINVRNNIFYGTGSGFAYMQFRQYGSTGTGHPTSSNVINNNVYYKTTGTNSWNWANVTYTTLAAWQSASSQDAQGLNSNPLFVDATPETADDVELQAGSPAIDAGTDLSSIFTTDYNGVTRTTTWDAGCYQYVP